MSNLHDSIYYLVKERFSDLEGSHDWLHIERVYKMATYIQSQEGGPLETIQLAALLHDISDHKYNGGDFNAGSSVAEELLINHGASALLAQEVAEIISKISFKGALVEDKKDHLALSIVRDADRLDAIGAIGIARAFSYGGSRNRPLFSPEVNPTLHSSQEDYFKSKSHTVNHFYEKLLLLKDRMETNTAKKIAAKRHDLMLDFIDAFKQEWELDFSKIE